MVSTVCTRSNRATTQKKMIISKIRKNLTTKTILRLYPLHMRYRVVKMLVEGEGIFNKDERHYQGGSRV